MKTKTRLTIWIVLTAIVLSTGIGITALLSSRASDYRAIDRKIDVVIGDVLQAKGEPLSAALYSIQSHNFDFALVVTPDGSAPISVVSPFGSDLIQMKLRSRDLRLPNGDVITISAPTADIEANFRKNSIQLAGLITPLNALYIILGIFYIRNLSRREDRIALAKMQTFLGDASHELRTPLTVIKGYSELLASGQLVDEVQRARAQERVGNEITRMESIISDLLLLAELGEVKEPTFEQVDLSDVVESHAKDFAALHPQRSVSLDIDEVHIQGNGEHLHRLMNNVLGNIDRHTPLSAPVRITLKKEGKTKLVIEDGGPGLPNEMYGEAVTHFQRFDKSRSREKGGSGLGMSIMQAITHEHHGTFQVRASELGGVAVEILLP